MLAAQKYGAVVIGYGLVGSQNDGMRMLIRARNFRGKLTLLERDHRELANEPSRYNRFVSIGVHKYAGRGCNEKWIRSIDIGPRPGGIGLISATLNMKKRPTNYCTIKHIVPGGYIPKLAETLVLTEKYGLDARAIENLSYHYHCSVTQRLKIFETHRKRIHAIDPVRLDEKIRRAWLFYLGGRSRIL